MKRVIAIALAAGLLAVFSTGCGKSEKTVYSSKDGKVTVKTDKAGGSEQTVNVDTEEGSATVTTGQDKTITEAELGAPVYPGAKVDTAGKYQGNDAGETQSVEQHILHTTDDFDKVAAFYKSNLKNVKNEQNVTSGDSKTAIFMVGEDKKQMMVQISRDAKEKRTLIHVIKQGM